jgi:Transcriptional regulatory protein, C terminal
LADRIFCHDGLKLTIRRSASRGETAMKNDNYQSEPVNPSQREFLDLPSLALAVTGAGGIASGAQNFSSTRKADRDRSPSTHNPQSMSLLAEEPNHSPTKIRAVRLKDINNLTCFLLVLVLVPWGDINSWPFPGHDEKPANPVSPKLSNATEKGIHSAVRSCVKNADREIAFGSVTLNFSTMEVRRNSEAVVLTKLEFRVLRYLVQHPRCVLTRDQLLNEVWGYESYPCTRTVDNQILRLRHKLEQVPSSPVHFLTVHGVGYKFIP